jgi:hypothetical protein
VFECDGDLAGVNGEAGRAWWAKVGAYIHVGHVVTARYDVGDRVDNGLDLADGGLVTLVVDDSWLVCCLPE